MHAPGWNASRLKAAVTRRLMARRRIVLRLGPGNRSLSPPTRPLRPATLVARGRRLRDDRRRIAHAADGMAECRRGDSEPEGGGPPRGARARGGPCAGHSETRENRGPVSDQTETPPGLLPPPAESIGWRPDAIFRSIGGRSPKRPARTRQRGSADR